MGQAEVEQLLSLEKNNPKMVIKSDREEAVTNPNDAVQDEKAPMVGKKRDREEAFGSAADQKIDEPTVDDILTQIKQKVLLGETMNSFKKEIN